MSDMDTLIERIKDTTKTIADLLADIDKQRAKDLIEMDKRIKRLEYEIFNK